MRFALALLAVLSCTSSAAAQVPCGLPGISIEVSPANPMLGQPIAVTLHNNSAQTIQLPSSCTFSGIFTGSNCISSSVFIPICLTVIVPIAPGGSRSMTWNQTDDLGNPVPVGGYSVEVRYFDANFTQSIVCCIPFDIGPNYPSLCSGDGGNQMGCTPCPCGNDAPVGSPGGCSNPDGRTAELLVSGSAAVSGDTLHFDMTGGSSSSFAVLVSGDAIAPTNPANPCFGLGSGVTANSLDGLRCAVQQVQRHGARSTDANGDAGTGAPGPGQNGWGPPAGPPGGLIAQGGFALGQTRFFQALYRTDPLLGCLTGQNSSQAVRVDFTP